MTQRCVVYRWYDDEGNLLYVGMSGRLHERTAAHSRGAAWWERAVRCEATVYATRADAARAESIAIAAENPECNVIRPIPEAQVRLRVESGSGLCDVCGNQLPPPPPGRGRPPLRHPECQVEHRREYLRDAKRRERA